MSFLFFLLLTGVVSATQQLSDDGAKAKDSSSLTDSRLDKVERLLLEQDAKLTNQENMLRQQKSLLRQQSAKLTSQESLLRQQSAKLTSQEILLRQQSAKLTSQEILLRQQKAKVSLQESLLRQQSAKLTNQESLLRQQSAKLTSQESLLRQQEAKVSLQVSLLRQQSAKLTSQESVLRQQSAKLSRQETVLFQYGKLIQQLRAEKLDTRQSESQNGHASDRLISLPEILTARMDNDPTDMEPPLATPANVETVTSISHDVMSRSDQGEPLEDVVSQISQRVTEMSADIHALKTQTTRTNTDIQAMKTQTTQTNTDIQAMKTQTTRTNTNIQALKTQTTRTNTDIQAMKTQTTQTNTDIQALKNSDTQQDHGIQDARSSTFVHWGSSQCSGASSQLVYSGVVGGSWHHNTGAATNYLCLTLSPVFGDDKQAWTYLYGAEYETFDSHQDKDAVCAVCRSTFSTTVMIPGTNVCTPGWHMQYSGFLMAGDAGQPAGSEYICVDSHLESRVGSDQDEISALLHYTTTRCGSLPCGPYVNDKGVTCVVCGK